MGFAIVFGNSRGTTSFSRVRFWQRRQRRSKACPHCDTRLWAEPVNRPSLAMLRPTTLQRHREFDPVAHLFTRNALPWLMIPEGMATFESQPDEAGELLRLWQERTSRSGA
ncbi:MAG: GFA family protein [Janthinobacterium lividum]